LPKRQHYAGSDRPWSASATRRTVRPASGVYHAADGPFYIACANDRLYRRLVVDVLERPILMTDRAFCQSKSAVGQQGRAASRINLARFLATDVRENWMAKMKKVNVPVGYLRTVRGGIQCARSAATAIAQPDQHPTAGSVPNIDPRSA